MIRDDWSEYVYNTDLAGAMWEITTAAYNLVDKLMQLDGGERPLTEWHDELRPFHDRLRDLIEPDIRKYTGEDEE